MAIVENIKGLCEKRGITFAELERESGLGKGSISKWNKSSPTVASLQKVAAYFQVSVNRLLKEPK